MKKIARLRQLTLARYNRVYRQNTIKPCQLRASEIEIDIEIDTPTTDSDDGQHCTLSLQALTSFVIDERRIKQHTRARNFLWLLAQSNSTPQH